jgi:hypothetical protein
MQARFEVRITVIEEEEQKVPNNLRAYSKVQRRTSDSQLSATKEENTTEIQLNHT